MCGIVAIVGEAGPGEVRELLGRLAHRGPDGEGVLAVPGDAAALLGHRRLAIIDPAGGRQPLGEAAGPALVANGMIYNDRQLRDELGPAAYRTGSDCESILAGWSAWGEAVASRLDGMFAFVVADAGGVVAVRDPVGIKPLYHARSGERTLLASEVKALAGAAAVVHELPPGHLLDVRSGATRRYYRLPEPATTTLPVATAIGELRRTLETAVLKRLRSDVPLGCLLSGGLDSSAIAAIARRHLDELHTFAVGLAGSPDLAAARVVARHLRTVHHELVVTPAQVLAELPRILFHLENDDPDLVRSAVPCWFVSRLAAERVKVVLTGEGADELFAGYAYHKEYGAVPALQAELRRSIGAMHNMNLQRVDRMTMAHGLEARVPYLDRDMLALAMRIDVAHKLRAGDGRLVEKWVLRRAVEDLLPPEIVWRTKVQFDEGSGLAGLLAGLAAERGVSEADWYRELLSAGFDDPAPVLRLSARWAADRVGQRAS